jgi:hypothetical protein
VGGQRGTVQDSSTLGTVRRKYLDGELRLENLALMLMLNAQPCSFDRAVLEFRRERHEMVCTVQYGVDDPPICIAH